MTEQTTVTNFAQTHYLIQQLSVKSYLFSWRRETKSSRSHSQMKMTANRQELWQNRCLCWNQTAYHAKNYYLTSWSFFLLFLTFQHAQKISGDFWVFWIFWQHCQVFCYLGISFTLLSWFPVPCSWSMVLFTWSMVLFTWSMVLFSFVLHCTFVFDAYSRFSCIAIFWFQSVFLNGCITRFRRCGLKFFMAVCTIGLFPQSLQSWHKIYQATSEHANKNVKKEQSARGHDPLHLHRQKFNVQKRCHRAWESNMLLQYR